MQIESQTESPGAPGVCQLDPSLSSCENSNAWPLAVWGDTSSLLLVFFISGLVLVKLHVLTLGAILSGTFLVHFLWLWVGDVG